MTGVQFLNTMLVGVFLAFIFVFVAAADLVMAYQDLKKEVLRLRQTVRYLESELGRFTNYTVKINGEEKQGMDAIDSYMKFTFKNLERSIKR